MATLRTKTEAAQAVRKLMKSQTPTSDELWAAFDFGYLTATASGMRAVKKLEEHEALVTRVDREAAEARAEMREQLSKLY